MCLCPRTVRIEECLYEGSKTKFVSYQKVPCGNCPECRSLRRMQWTFRLEQESLVHPFAYFITLTYADRWLPKDGQLYKPDFQEFVKLLRTRLVRLYGIEYKDLNLKYFACGEYGDQFGRCHMHAILFSDFGISYSDVRDAWSYGFVYFDPFTSGRAAYVVKYSQKQLFTDYPENVQPPFSLSSLGLGACWLTPSMLRYYRETLLTTVYTLSGDKIPLPRYFYKKIFDRATRKKLSQQNTLKRWQVEKDRYASFGQFANLDGKSIYNRKWQNAYDNFISKHQLNFHYEEDPVYN